MASKARRAPRRIIPGEIDVFVDLAFVAEVSRMAVSGELSCLDAVRMISDAVVAKDPIRIADWAAANLVVPAGKSSRPGPMRLTRMQAAIADILQREDVRQVTYLKGPQIGFSFLIAAVLLYYGAHENKPTLCYDRALKNSKSFYEEKWEAILRASDEISHLLPEEKSSTVRQRWTDRIFTSGAGARFRSVSDKIKSDTATVLAADEAGDSTYMNKGSNTEGSKIGLLRGRVVDQPGNKMLIGGTPTAAGESAVTDEWEKSNKCEWVMQFACCGTEGPFVDDVREVRIDQIDVPHGPGLRYTRDELGCTEVWYECAGCCRRVPPTEKVALLETGRWEPTAIGLPGQWGVRSWMAHSQSPEATWSHIANEHIAAVETPDKMQVFTNLWLAREWKPAVAKLLEVSDLKAKVVVLRDGKLPRGIRFLFAGIDVQRGKDDGSKPGRTEVVVIGVGENMTFHVVGHWVVDHRELVDPETGEIVRVPVLPLSGAARQPVMDILDQTFETEDGRTLRILNTGCDVSYEMEQATAFIRSISTPTRPVVPVRGVSDADGRKPAIGHDRDAQSFVFRNGVVVQKLGTNSIKDYLALTLANRSPGPQSWSFPEGMPDEFFVDLLAEQLVETKSGRTIWKRRDKNVTGEVWDCIVYAYAAHLMLREWSGDWGATVMIPQIRIRPEVVEATLIEDARRVHAEAQAEKIPARPTPTPAPVSAPVTVEETIVESVQRRLDDMFSTIEDDEGPAFEIVLRQPVRPAPVEEPDENPFIIAGRR